MFQSVSVSSKGSPEAVVVGVFRGSSGPAKLDAATRSRDDSATIERALKLPECTGKPGSIAEAFTEGRSRARVIVVGLGENKSFTMTTLRKAACAAFKRLATVKAASAEIDLAGPVADAGLDEAESGRAAGEVAGLMTYDADRYKGDAGKADRKKPKLALRSASGAFAKGLRRGLSVAEGINFARELGDAPPNIANPSFMAQQARALARKHDTLSVRVISGQALETEKLTGIATVGRASDSPPCLIRVAYTPKNAAKNAKPIVIVGKTITYDTGGLSLKIQGSMAGMKHDKCGGCAALGAMQIIAQVVKPKRPVIALLPAAENAVSDNAFRPDDVLTFRNGVTVEITNTDAEGRLVMADAMCWACDKEKPGCIIDMATLTGGVVVALGSTFAGLWSDDDGLRGRIERAADLTGERVWRLPLDEEYSEMMKSDVADILNSNPNRKAHATQGAAFLQNFVEKSVPWAHIDIAGTADAESTTGPYVKGATGFGARLVARAVEEW